MNVSRVDYVREMKELTVVFDDDTRKLYMNVSDVAAAAMFSSPSLTHHYQKYIKGIYLEITEGHACPAAV